MTYGMRVLSRAQSYMRNKGMKRGDAFKAAVESLK